MASPMEALQKAVAEDPALAGRLAALKDVDRVSAELAAVARERGLALTEAEIRAAFQRRAGGPAEPLEDAALDAVAGAGSPWCIFTSGCYCVFTH